MKKNKIHKWILYTLATIAVLLAMSFLTVYFLKDKLINLTVSQINTYLDTKIEVDPDIDVSLYKNFPHITVSFSNVKIFEHPSIGDEQICEAQSIGLSFNIINLWNKNYTIDKLIVQDGFLTIKVNQEGKVNYHIFKPDTLNNANDDVKFVLEEIALSNINFIYNNIPAVQYHEILVAKANAKLSYESSAIHVFLKTKSNVKQIGIDNQIYFQSKEIDAVVECTINTNKKILEFKKSEINVEQAQFMLEGTIGYEPHPNLNIHVKQHEGSIYTLLSLIPDQYTAALKTYQSEGNIYLDAKIKGDWRNNKFPLIEVNFGFKNAAFYHPDYNKKITNAFLTGYFTNGHTKSVVSSVLRLENISCLMDNKTLKGNIAISNFKEPYLKIEAQGNIDAKFIHDFYPVPNIESLNGLLDINIKFKGKIADLKNAKTSINVSTEGEITFKDIDIKHKQLPYHFSSMNGVMLFNNNDVSVSDFKFKADNSDVLLNIFLKNAVGNLIYHNSSLYIEGDIKSQYLNLDKLLSSEKTTQPATAAVSSASTKKRADYALLKINFDLKNIHYNNATYTAVKGDLVFLQNKLYFNKLDFNWCGGKFETQVNLDFSSPKLTEVRALANVKDVAIDSLFYFTKNFGQSFMTYKNIKGEVSGNIDALVDLDEKFEINTQSAIIDANIKIRNGALTDFEPMQKLSKFIDNQKLSRISFSELENKFVINGGIITIPDMFIKSNIANINIAGTHTFNNQMDYRLTIPLNNLSKQKTDSDEAFGAIAPDQRGEPKIHLTIKGTSDNYKIAYDKQKTQEKIKNSLQKEKLELIHSFKRDNRKIKVEEKEKVEKASQQFFDFDE